MPQPCRVALGVLSTLLAAGLASAQAPADSKKGAAPAAQSPKPANTAPKPATKAAPKLFDEPRVLSAEESARRAKGSSVFLGPPAGDRYGETVPWSEVPAWRRASFYGVRSVAQTVVFVVDCSGSMGDNVRLERAKIELRRTVNALQFPQRFTVIFYDDEPIPMPGTGLQSADTIAKDQFVAWLRLIDADGGTDPRSALSLAMGLRPDAIYLLSDGAFPEGTVEDVAARNRRKLPIHCIDLAGGSAGDHLRRIARDSGGQYASRP
ncbi:MAG TPA: VWA domain-containing protein [Isosphaeraceae bacterium]